MDLLVKILKAVLLSEDGEISKSTAQKIKDGLLWLLLGIGLCFGILCYVGNEDEETEDANDEETEYVEYTDDEDDDE